MQEQWSLTERDFETTLHLFRLIRDLRSYHPHTSLMDLAPLLAFYANCPVHKVRAFIEEMQELI